MSNFIETESVLYLRLQAYIWPLSAQSFYSNVSSVVSASLIPLVIRSGETGKPLVVNCRRVLRLLSHAMKPLSEACSKNPNATIAFFEVDGSGSITDGMSDSDSQSSVANELELQLRNLGSLIFWNNSPSFAIFGRNAQSKSNSVQSFLSGKVNEVEQVSIENFVRQSYQTFSSPTRLASTPMLASGVFKAAQITGRPDSMSLVVMRLTDMLEEVLTNESVSPEVRLLACSRHGASLAFCVLPFARSLGVEGIDIVDRLGPTHCYIEEYSTRRSVPFVDDFSYILISDFVIGGSEIRAAMAHAHERKRRVTHAVCLGSVLDKTDFPSCSLVSLVDLKKLGLDLSYKLC
jgi:hypothetical protein